MNFNFLKKFFIIITVELLFLNMLACTDNSEQNKNVKKQSIELSKTVLETPKVSNTLNPKNEVFKGKVICIDPGHQKNINLSKEAIAPNSNDLKEKMVLGAKGVVTNIAESKLNLDVSLKLKKALESREAKVVMTRVEEDVDLGNIDRAQIANNCNANAFVRIHADGSASSATKGLSVLYLGPQYIKDQSLINESKKLSTYLMNSLKESTKASVITVERSDLTGHNWSKVPVTLVEMGFMTNPEEDMLMQTNDYQMKIVEGIVNGLENYLKK